MCMVGKEVGRELGDLALSAGLAIALGRYMSLGKIFNLLELFPTHETKDLDLVRYFSFL